MDDTDIEIIGKDSPYSGFLRIERYRLRHRKFDGTWTEVLTREVCRRGAAVAVLLYDPDRDVVGLIEQFRMGAAAAGGPAWLTEIVAGIVDEGETTEEVARREAMEEAGCAVGALEHICDYFPSPGAFDEWVTVFCGRMDARTLGTTGGVAHEHEDIRILTVPAGEAIRRLDGKEFKNSVTIIALGWFARHRDRLRAEWRSSTENSTP